MQKKLAGVVGECTEYRDVLKGIEEIDKQNMKIIKIAQNQTNEVIKSYLECILEYYRSGGKKDTRDDLMISFLQQISVSLHYVNRLDEVLAEHLPALPDGTVYERIAFVRNKFNEIYDVNHFVRGLLFDVGGKGSENNKVSLYPNTVRYNVFKDPVDNSEKLVSDQTYRKYVPFLNEFSQFK